MTASQLTLYRAAWTGALVIESSSSTARVAEAIHHRMRFIVALPLLPSQARVVGGDAGRVVDPSVSELRVIGWPLLKAPEFPSRVKLPWEIGIPLLEGRDCPPAIVSASKFSYMAPTGHWGCRID
jgi:hypothetical protein